MAFKLDPGSDICGEIIRVARKQLAEAAQYARRRSEPLAERVHAGRTTCKKVRAALKFLRGQDRARYRTENRWLRDAARKLSALRDAETAVATLRTLLQQPHGRHRQRKFAPLVRALHAQHHETLSSPAAIERKLTRFSERLEAAEVRLGCWEPAADLKCVIRQHRRVYKRARAGLTAAQELGTATAFHEWRKAVKAYGYQCRLLRAAWPPAMKELHRELKELAVLLGDEHDLTNLRKTLARLKKDQIANLGDDLLAAARDAIEARRDKLRAQAIPLGERVFVDRPRIVSERMTQWWATTQHLDSQKSLKS